MKIQASAGKTTVSITKDDWIRIGQKAGWIAPEQDGLLKLDVFAANNKQVGKRLFQLTMTKDEFMANHNAPGYHVRPIEKRVYDELQKRGLTKFTLAPGQNLPGDGDFIYNMWFSSVDPEDQGVFVVVNDKSDSIYWKWFDELCESGS